MHTSHMKLNKCPRVRMLKKILNKFLSYLPTPLPMGMTAYLEWSKSIADLLGPITSIESDLHFCISAEVIRLGPSVWCVSKHYFVRRVRAGVAKQIAGAVFTDIKEKDKQLKAAEAARSAEVTAAQKAADGQQDLPTT